MLLDDINNLELQMENMIPQCQVSDLANVQYIALKERLLTLKERLKIQGDE